MAAHRDVSCCRARRPHAWRCRCHLPRPNPAAATAAAGRDAALACALQGVEVGLARVSGICLNGEDRRDRRFLRRRRRCRRQWRRLWLGPPLGPALRLRLGLGLGLQLWSQAPLLRLLLPPRLGLLRLSLGPEDRRLQVVRLTLVRSVCQQPLHSLHRRQLLSGSRTTSPTQWHGLLSR